MQDSKKGEVWGKAKVPMEFRKRPVSEVRCRSQRRESSGERQKPRESHESDLHRRFDAGAKEGRAPGERHKKPRTLSERNEAKRWAAREVGSPSRSPGTGSDACKYLSEGSQAGSPGFRQKPRRSNARDLLRRLHAGVEEGGALGKGKSPHGVTIETCSVVRCREKARKAELWGKAKSPIESR